MHLESWLRLVLAEDIGPVLGHRLLKQFGSPERVFEAPARALLEVGGMGAARQMKLVNPQAAVIAAAEIDRATAAGVRIIPLSSPEYPELLKRLEYPPLVLWVKGRIDPADRLGLALVGPRSPSAYARLMVGSLVPPLAARGLAIISGLAHGIDAEAHKAALDAGGRTLAVLGQGLGTPVYPQFNAELARRIVEEDRGALVSVCPMQTEPAPGLFPQRNEIIAGLSLGTLVIEASEASGSLITARHAAAMGRPVMACPGDATRRAAHGSNRLIADGAYLIQNADDVLAAMACDLRREGEELGLGPAKIGEGDRAKNGQMELEFAEEKIPPEGGAPERGTIEHGARGAAADPVSREILGLLETEPLPVDVILDCCGEKGHAPSAVLERLLRLEMDGFLRQMPGRIYALARV